MKGSNMLINRNSRKVNSPPIHLAGGILEIADDLACPRCDTKVRGIDAELLEVGIRLICPRCHHLVFSFEAVR
jgi:hypothetical protein